MRQITTSEYGECPRRCPGPSGAHPSRGPAPCAARSIIAARRALVPTPAGCAGLRIGLSVLVAPLLRADSPSRASGVALDARRFFV
jgi:hypothetical protein